MQNYNLGLGYQAKVVGLMNKPSIIVANLGRVNNTRPSEARMTNLIPSSEDATLPTPPSGQTLEHRKKTIQDDCNILGESWITDPPNPPPHPIYYREETLENYGPATLNTPQNRGENL